MISQDRLEVGVDVAVAKETRDHVRGDCAMKGRATLYGCDDALWLAKAWIEISMDRPKLEE